MARQVKLKWQSTDADQNLAASLPMIRTLVASVLSPNRLSQEEALYDD